MRRMPATTILTVANKVRSVITHYVIQSSDDEGVTWQELDGAVMGTVYEDEDLTPGQTRDYRVAAVHSRRGGQSVWSNTADETTIPAVLPNEPGGLVAEAYGQNAIKRCWNTQAEQPEDAPVTAYLIEYSADGEAGWGGADDGYGHDRRRGMSTPFTPTSTN